MSFIVLQDDEPRMKSEAMAPTSDAIRFHLMRVHYQAMIWRNTHCLTPQLPASSEMGWRLDESGLQPVGLLCQQVLYLTVVLQCYLVQLGLIARTECTAFRNQA